MGGNAIQRTLQFTHVGGDFFGQKLKDLLRDGNGKGFSLGLQDAEAQFIGGGVNIRHQPPAQAGFQPLFHALKVAGRFIRRDNHLAILVHQRIERMEKFFLCRVLAADELHVINHQHIDGTKLFLERHRIPEPQRPDKLVHELFRREVNHPAVGMRLGDVPSNGVHQMGFAQAHAAIEKQRVEGYAFRFRHTACGSEGQLVGFADNKIVERAARVELCGKIAAFRQQFAERFAATGAERFCRRGRNRGSSQFRWGRNGWGIARWCCWQRAGIGNHQLDGLQGGVEAFNQVADAVAVVRLNPVAHKAGGDGQINPGAIHIMHTDGLQPTAESSFADLGPQAILNGLPLFPVQGARSPSRHHKRVRWNNSPSEIT